MDTLIETRTTFVIDYPLTTVRTSNAIMVLENGRFIERSNHGKLLAVNGRYVDLYNEIMVLESVYL